MIALHIIEQRSYGLGAGGRIGEHLAEHVAFPGLRVVTVVIYQRHDRKAGTSQLNEVKRQLLPHGVIRGDRPGCTGEMEPFRDQFVDVGDVLFEGGKAIVVPIDYRSQ